MSLTSFLNNKDVRRKFQEEFPKPTFSIKRELLAPPLTQNYGLVGTAFDYLLRFYIKYLNPSAITRPWVSESALKVLKKYKKNNNIIIGNKGKIGFLKSIKDLQANLITNNRRLKRLAFIGVKKIIKRAKSDYLKYLKNGRIENDLIESTLLISRLDYIIRPGRISKNLGIIDDKDIEDLNNLISIVNPKNFKANKICLLNPTFGNASKLVGGADADLVVDDMLIDIKTTKNFQLSRNYFNQLIGYYTLYKIGGIDGMPLQNEIKKLGIYFSRQGYLHWYEVDGIIDENRFPEFIKWFKKKSG